MVSFMIPQSNRPQLIVGHFLSNDIDTENLASTGTYITDINLQMLVFSAQMWYLPS